MIWKNRPNGLTWSGPIKNEEAKREVAAQLAAKLVDGQTVGIGSGSTSFLTLQALAARGLPFTAIPTSIEVSLACASLGVPTTTLNNAKPDWSFDGADEVDADKRLIKGRGGALYQEKLMMAAAPECYIVVDASKRVQRLGEKFPVPVEIDRDALSLMYEKLDGFPGLTEVAMRTGAGKDGPVITERGNLLLDLTFSEIGADAHDRLKAMPGVVETGLFVGFDFELLVSE